MGYPKAHAFKLYAVEIRRKKIGTWLESRNVRVVVFMQYKVFDMKWFYYLRNKITLSATQYKRLPGS